MRRRSLYVRFALPLFLALAGAVTPTSPAAADPGDVDQQALALIGEGQAAFYYYPATSTIEVRLSGHIPASSRVAGTWAAVITGHRQATATSIPVPIAQTWTDTTSYDVFEQFYFPNTGDFGSLAVDFSYTAAGEYVVVHSVHALEWNPLLGMNTTGADIG